MFALYLNFNAAQHRRLLSAALLISIFPVITEIKLSDRQKKDTSTAGKGSRAKQITDCKSWFLHCARLMEIYFLRCNGGHTVHQGYRWECVFVFVLPSFSGSRVIATLSRPEPRLTRWGVAVWTFSPFPVSIRSKGGDCKHQKQW